MADITIDPGETGDTVHVLPADDLIEHDRVEGCVCGPYVEVVQREDGTFGMVIIHHSLDGRELRE